MRKFDQVNVIPFIDIMLVLLAIVLTTASFVSQGLIEVNLPVASNSQSANGEGERKVVEISINSEKKFYINDEEVDIEALDRQLKVLTKEHSIILRVDAGVPFKQFVLITDRLKKYKLNKISILTKKVD